MNNSTTDWCEGFICQWNQSLLSWYDSGMALFILKKISQGTKVRQDGKGLYLALTKRISTEHIVSLQKCSGLSSVHTTCTEYPDAPQF